MFEKYFKILEATTIAVANIEIFDEKSKEEQNEVLLALGAFMTYLFGIAIVKKSIPQSICLSLEEKMILENKLKQSYYGEDNREEVLFSDILEYCDIASNIVLLHSK